MIVVFWVVMLSGGYQHTASVFMVSKHIREHSITIQKTRSDIFTSVRTSNLIYIVTVYLFDVFYQNLA